MASQDAAPAAHSVSSPVVSSQFTPIPASDRVFSFRDHAALWFSLGVGLLVIQIGAFLGTALGTKTALFAIVAGSLIGAALLALVAYIGFQRGLSSPILMCQTLGSSFAKLPVVLNVVQLIGWSAFELVVMRDGTTALVKDITGIDAVWLPYVAALFWGLLLVGLATGSMIGLVRWFVGRFGLPLVILSLVWLTWQFGIKAQAQGWEAIWNRAGDGSMSTLAGIDLVMAMPVSWLPLVADFARYGRAGGTTFRGTWLGFAIANMWCHALGVLVVSTTDVGADLMAALLLAQGGLIALGLILIDEMDNAYGDVYSGSVALNFLNGRHSIRFWGIALASVATCCALFLPMHGIEPFLLMLSSVFVPLFGVVVSQLAGNGIATERRVNPVPVAIWIIGIVSFHLCPAIWPQVGSAIPALCITLLLGTIYRLTRTTALQAA
ncbi:purine-cytosine permease family protein [Oxalicibacterium faecigallinarum]|uniref:Nitrate reductase n=1 Tax=Oxalicibacterium faecigallinarum TaxID=573741 RepID=A0A8J3F5Q2_9BURK|nr:cytosine permease [Oxalicibacterium faecigallinarum]GGI18126.1 nitrate reductase [Oxalicibacterium faecigallinarum]